MLAHMALRPDADPAPAPIVPEPLNISDPVVNLFCGPTLELLFPRAVKYYT